MQLLDAQTHRGEQRGVTGLPVFTRPILPCCVCASRIDCPAVRPYRALRAFWLSRHANERAQLHDRLIEFPGALSVARHQSTCEFPNLARCGMRDAGCACSSTTTYPASRISRPEKHAQITRATLVSTASTTFSSAN